MLRPTKTSLGILDAPFVQVPVSEDGFEMSVLESHPTCVSLDVLDRFGEVVLSRSAREKLHVVTYVHTFQGHVFSVPEDSSQVSCVNPRTHHLH